MSRYAVNARDVGREVHVGWLPDSPAGGFWFAIFDAPSSSVITEGGFDAPVPTLADLVGATWSAVDWHRERSVLLMLRDDPWVERLTADPGPPGMAQLLAELVPADGK